MEASYRKIYRVQFALRAVFTVHNPCVWDVFGMVSLFQSTLSLVPWVGNELVRRKYELNK